MFGDEEGCIGGHARPPFIVVVLGEDIAFIIGSSIRWSIFVLTSVIECIGLSSMVMRKYGVLNHLLDSFLIIGCIIHRNNILNRSDDL